MTYFDSAVLVKAYCLEATTPQALSLIRQANPPLLFTPLHAIEIRNALRLKRYRRELTGFQLSGALACIRDDINRGFLQVPDLDFRAAFDRAEILSAAYTPVTGARSLDILHVAAAQLCGSKQFVSFDRRQRSLARKSGLRILPRSIPKPV